MAIVSVEVDVDVYDAVIELDSNEKFKLVKYLIDGFGDSQKRELVGELAYEIDLSPAIISYWLERFGEHQISDTIYPLGDEAKAKLETALQLYSFKSA